jgi:hypothetical protein
MFDTTRSRFRRISKTSTGFFHDNALFALEEFVSVSDLDPFLMLVQTVFILIFENRTPTLKAVVLRNREYQKTGLSTLPHSFTCVNVSQSRLSTAHGRPEKYTRWTVRRRPRFFRPTVEQI